MVSDKIIQNRLMSVNNSVSRSAEGRHFCMSKGPMNQMEKLLNDAEA